MALFFRIRHSSDVVSTIALYDSLGDSKRSLQDTLSTICHVSFTKADCSGNTVWKEAGEGSPGGDAPADSAAITGFNIELQKTANESESAVTSVTSHFKQDARSF